MKNPSILIPIDFSACSINALRLAKKIALSTQARLLLMTVIRSPEVHADAIGAGVIAAPVMINDEAEMDEQYEKLITSEALEDLDITKLFFTSGFNDAIEACLSEFEVDMIITGTHEDHGLLDQLLGSNSSEIIRKADIPVLMVPETETQFNYKKIGLAIDFNEKNDFKKLAVVRDFAMLFGASITVIHVADRHDALFTHDDEKVELSSYLKGTDYSFYTFDSKKEVVDVLLDKIDELELDMIFMHPKKYRGIEGWFHQSKTKAMALNARITLLTLHE